MWTVRGDTRWIVTGTHQAELFGVPATGKQLSVEGMNFYHLRDGKITDVWTQYDGISILQQLGALPDEPESVVQRDAAHE